MNDTQAGTLRILRSVYGGCVPRDSVVVHHSRNTSCLDSRIAVDCNTARACGRLPVDWTIFTYIISVDRTMKDRTISVATHRPVLHRPVNYHPNGRNGFE